MLAFPLDAPVPVSDTLEQAKMDCRKRARSALARLSAHDQVEASERICRAIAACKCWGVCSTVLAFQSVPGEPDLTELIVSGLADGKRVALPRIDWAAVSMDPAPIRDLDRDLIATKHGLREPKKTCGTIEVGAIDIVLVPGMAFDRSGRRVGRGGGFYDRFLARPDRRAKLVGVAFEAQVMDRVPTGARDIAVDFLATETGVRAVLKGA